MVEVPQNMHFEVPDQMTRSERTRDSIITAVLWGVYLYLWVPLVSLLAWAMGFEFAYDVMVRAGGARDLLPILLEYAVVVSVILSAFTTWSVSNRLRFKHMTRRSRRPPVADDALSEYFGVSVAEIGAMRSHQIMRIDFDEDGTPQIDTLGPEQTDDDDFYDSWSIADDDDSEPIRDITATGWS